MLRQNVELRLNGGQTKGVALLLRLPPRLILSLGLCGCLACTPLNRHPRIATPLERSGYQRLPESSEISAYLGSLERSSPLARRVVIGVSAGGRPLEVLLVSHDRGFLENIPTVRTGVWEENEAWPEGESSGKLKIMFVGSQHGTEPSGAEAILVFARDLLAGRFPRYLEAFDFILVPNSNPDGRDRHRRVNANNVNLSTDYGLLSQPESRAVNQSLLRWRPHVLLDLHESAVYKRKSLGRQGFMTDFEAQFEIANNPNVDSGIQGYSGEKILPELISKVEAAGIPARHYIGEITDIGQPITHGGLSVRNLRNKAGLMGTFSFLVENRLDPPQGVYAKPRNIDRRVAKQYICLKEFLETCYAHRRNISALARAARGKWRSAPPNEPVYLQPAYVASPSEPEITLGLRRVESGERVFVRFAYRGAIERGAAVVPPPSYLIIDKQKEMGELLGRHGIEFERAGHAKGAYHRLECVAPSLHGPPRSARIEHRLRAADLFVSLRQPLGKLIPLLLEPVSAGGPLRSPPPAGIARDGEAPFICRMPLQTARGPVAGQARLRVSSALGGWQFGPPPKSHLSSRRPRPLGMETK